MDRVCITALTVLGVLMAIYFGGLAFLIQINLQYHKHMAKINANNRKLNKVSEVINDNEITML